jgi:hypothetical protein
LCISSYAVLSTLDISNIIQDDFFPTPTLSHVPVEEFYGVKDKKKYKRDNKTGNKKGKSINKNKTKLWIKS